MRGQGPPQSPHPDCADQQQSGQSAACRGARCCAKSCLRRWICTCHRHKKSASACRLRQYQRRSHPDLTQRLQLRQSSRWAANRKSAAKSFRRLRSSTRRRQPNRNRRDRDARARQWLRPNGLRGRGRSAAISARSRARDQFAERRLRKKSKMRAEQMCVEACCAC